MLTAFDVEAVRVGVEVNDEAFFFKFFSDGVRDLNRALAKG